MLFRSPVPNISTMFSFLIQQETQLCGPIDGSLMEVEKGPKVEEAEIIVSSMEVEAITCEEAKVQKFAHTVKTCYKKHGYPSSIQKGECSEQFC